MRKLLVSLALGSLMMIALVAPASARKAVIFERDLAGGGFLTCQGDFVDILSGTVTITEHTNTSTSGVVTHHIKSHYKNVRLADGSHFRSMQHVQTRDVQSHGSEERRWHAKRILPGSGVVESYFSHVTLTYSEEGDLVDVAVNQTFICVE